jgi:hypothetical protein
MKKEKWEIALEKFLDEWINKKEVVGIVACGSYITGNPSKHSDIDIQILLDKNVRWRERGNKIIDGILMEYFANPMSQIIKYFDEDYKDRTRTAAHMFITGKIVYDKNGAIKDIIKKAKEWNKRKFEPMSLSQKELWKYSLWDMNDNLEEVYEAKTDDFYFVYFNYLKKLYETYSTFLRFDSLSVNKLLKLLTIEKQKIKYKIKDYPDQHFVNLFIEAIKLKDKQTMIKEYSKLTLYVLDKMEGFDINGWKFRSPIEK